MLKNIDVRFSKGTEIDFFFALAVRSGNFLTSTIDGGRRTSVPTDLERVEQW